MRRFPVKKPALISEKYQQQTLSSDSCRKHASFRGTFKIPTQAGPIKECLCTTIVHTGVKLAVRTRELCTLDSNVGVRVTMLFSGSPSSVGPRPRSTQRKPNELKCNARSSKRTKAPIYTRSPDLQPEAINYVLRFQKRKRCPTIFPASTKHAESSSTSATTAFGLLCTVGYRDKHRISGILQSLAGGHYRFMLRSVRNQFHDTMIMQVDPVPSTKHSSTDAIRHS